MVEFILLVLLLLALSILVVLKKPKNIIEFFSNNKGALKGIFLAGLFVLVFGFALEKAIGGEWSPQVELFAGIDRTFKQSPQCETGKYNDKLTSAIGLTWVIYRNNNNYILMPYTHHSCEFNSDAKSYDAIGLHIKRIFEF